MIIMVDEEAKKALTALVDMSMKYGGIQVLSLINQVNAACQDYVPETKAE